MSDHPGPNDRFGLSVRFLSDQVEVAVSGNLDADTAPDLHWVLEEPEGTIKSRIRSGPGRLRAQLYDDDARPVQERPALTSVSSTS